MGLLFGQERRQWAAEPPIPPYLGASTGTGTSLTKPEQAMVVPAVWACVQLLAGAVAMMPLRTFRQTPTVAQRITDPSIVTSPSDGMTQSEWLHMLMVSLLLRGNAYGLKNTPPVGGVRPTQVTLLNPDRVDVRVDDDGTPRYTVGAARVDVTNRMWHVRGLTLPGSVVGLSPISSAALSIGVDLASRRFAKDFFDGGGIPKAVLESDMDIDQTQATTLKERLLAATRNREPVALGSGVKYRQISVAPNESQFLETQQANISDIARFFGIPAEMVGGKTGSSMTYQNVEQRSLDFLTYGVSFWLKRVEDAFFGLLPQPQFVQFDTTALLRTDAETEAKVRAIYVAAKVMPPSRILTEMNEEPLTAAEKEELSLVPLAVTAQGSPRVNPNASTSAASDTPDITPTPAPSADGAPASKPKLGVVNG